MGSVSMPPQREPVRRERKSYKRFNEVTTAMAVRAPRGPCRAAIRALAVKIQRRPSPCITTVQLPRSHYLPCCRLQSLVAKPSGRASSVRHDHNAEPCMSAT